MQSDCGAHLGLVLGLRLVLRLVAAAHHHRHAGHDHRGADRLGDGGRVLGSRHGVGFWLIARRDAVL
eukprot:2730967-Rhodomonas_salina.1